MISAKQLIIVSVGVIAITTGAILLRVPFYGTAIAISLLVFAVVILDSNLSLRSPLILEAAGMSILVWLLFAVVEMLKIRFPFGVLIYVGMGIVAIAVSRPSSGPFRTYQIYLKRIMGGDAAGVINELKDREKPSFSQLLALSTAYSWTGNGEQAEVFARRALELRPLPSDPPSSAKRRVRDSMHILALADALTAQGRYTEAIDQASYLQGTAMVSITNALWALCAGDEDQARRFLESAPSVTTRLGLKNSVTPKYQFMWFYLQHRLLDIERRPDLQRTATLLAEWEDEAARNLHNPYGQRLNEILSDLREVMRQ